MKSSRSVPALANKHVVMKCDIKSNKKYCGVCHKAGKPASEYESHYTRSVPGPNGVITCPIILSAVCKSCGKSGHFSDHCNVKKRISNNQNQNPIANISNKNKNNKISNTNLFSALDFDEDLLQVHTIKKNSINLKDEIKTLAPNGISFADMLLKPKPVIVKQISAVPAQQNIESTNNISKMLFAEKILSQRNRTSWLDSDSDCDDDDYDYDYDCDDSQSDW
jgi:hypothetical protein